MEYLATGRPAEILRAEVDDTSCNGTIQRFIRDGVWNAEGHVALSQITVLSSFIANPPDDPEQRMAFDVEMLGWLILGCMAFPGEEQACVKRAMRDLPPKSLSESPIFCDLTSAAPSQSLKADYAELSVPFPSLICGALLTKRPENSSQHKDWWTRVSAEFSSLLKHEKENKN